jgi:lipopolysaccharide/colanic/teichoic acid biosynthesis glycosyltransferase
MLGGVLRGELSLVGLAPLSPEQWAAADEEYRRDPPDAPVGLLHPAASLPPDGPDYLPEALAGNRRYVEDWSLGEDLRVLLDALRARSAARKE